MKTQHIAIIACSVIYDPKATDNEERSAELFVEFAKECFDEVIYYCLVHGIGIDVVTIIIIICRRVASTQEISTT